MTWPMLIWNLAVMGSAGYLVAFKDRSGWWIVLALLLLVSSEGSA